MSTNHQHVGARDIFLYLLDAFVPGRRDAIEAEIAACPACHELYGEVHRLEPVFACVYQDAPSTEDCPEEWEIGSFIGGDCPAGRSEEILRHLQHCDRCIDDASTFFLSAERIPPLREVPKLWKRRVVDVLSEGESAVDHRIVVSSRFRSLFDSVRNLLTPLPALPAYAAAALAVVLLVHGHLSRQDRLAVIPTTERIAFRSSEVPSSMGFLDGVEQPIVNRMDIREQGGQYIFRWSPIGRKSRYSFSLIERPGNGIVYSSGRKDDFDVRVPKTLVEQGRLYSWIIEGKTIEGADFRYTGDLIRVP